MVFVRSKVVKNIRYYYIAKGFRKNGKVKQKLVKWIGTADKLLEILEKTEFVTKDIEVQDIVEHGNILPFHQLYAELSIGEKINALMPKDHTTRINRGQLTEIMVLNAIFAHRSKQKIKNWYKITALPKLLNIPPDQLYAQLFCRTLDCFTEDRIAHLETQLTQELQTRFSCQLDQAFYDITSIYMEGDHCSFAEFGYNRDGKRQNKQIVFGLVIVPPHKFPILQKVYKGNTADVKTSKEVIQILFQQYGIQDVLVIVDRGMLSDEVRVQFQDLHLRYVSALDGDSREAKALILGTPRHLFRPITLENGRQVLIKRWVGTIRTLRQEMGLSHKNRRYHKELDDIPFLYIVGKSPEFSKTLKEAHYEALAKALTALKTFQEELAEKEGQGNKKGRPIDVDGRLKQIFWGVTRYFEYGWERVGDHIHLYTKFNRLNLRIARKTKGKFVFYASDLSLTNRQIVQSYSDKYQIEQAFRVLKSDLQIRPLWHYKTNRVIASLFISYLAYLLKTIVEYRIKKSHLPLSFKEVLEELSPLKQVTLQVGPESREIHPKISPMQQKIFKSLKTNLSD